MATPQVHNLAVRLGFSVLTAQTWQLRDIEKLLACLNTAIVIQVVILVQALGFQSQTIADKQYHKKTT